MDLVASKRFTLQNQVPPFLFVLVEPVRLPRFHFLSGDGPSSPPSSDEARHLDACIRSRGRGLNTSPASGGTNSWPRKMSRTLRSWDGDMLFIYRTWGGLGLEDSGSVSWEPFI